MSAPDSISADKLARLVGTPRSPVLLDLRSPEDFAADPRLVPGALRVDPLDHARIAGLASGGAVVCICQHGHRRSQGPAAMLRAAGQRAEHLEGGHAAWAAAGLPLVDTAPLPPRDAEGRTRWVTRARPKIDRIACPWLIRRFIDPRATILFVAPAEVAGVAELWNAAPFDIEGVRFSHRGDLCSFDAMLDDFGLDLAPLRHLARIVRGADTARPDLAPEAAGLLAASLGLSRMHADDHAQLEAGMTLYDAFYRWARDATGETHNWPSASVVRP